MTQRKWMAMVALSMVSAVFLAGCQKEKEPLEVSKKELLIYCGITMIRPMAEIARVIEAQENCKITIIKDGSGNLLKAIKANGVGDLYLPGSDSYIETCLKEGLVTETAFVGYNKAALMVQKGNPKAITADLDNLAKPDYYVVIGNAKSGSIGKETKLILEKKGIYDKVLANTKHLTTDSKDLITYLKTKEADLVINWYATATWEENRDHVDVLPIDPKYATPEKLVLGLLNISSHPDIARKFMAYASSEQGKAIFDKYGLYNVQ